MKGHPGVEFFQAIKITITIDHCGTAPKITKPCEDGVIPLELSVCVYVAHTSQKTGKTHISGLLLKSRPRCTVVTHTHTCRGLSLRSRSSGLVAVAGFGSLFADGSSSTTPPGKDPVAADSHPTTPKTSTTTTTTSGAKESGICIW